MMNDEAGHHEFIKASAAQLVEQFSQSTPDGRAAIAAATGVRTDLEIDQHRQQLVADFTKVSAQANREVPQSYSHYASRFDVVGLYQSVLSKVFSGISGLQGYGDRNPVWVTTLLEEAGFRLKSFFHQIHELEGAKKPLLQAIVEAWKQISLERAPYPPGLPATIPIENDYTVALLADWAGDNPAAMNVADVVRRAKPQIAIHLGDKSMAACFPDGLKSAARARNGSTAAICCATKLARSLSLWAANAETDTILCVFHDQCAQRRFCIN